MTRRHVVSRLRRVWPLALPAVGLATAGALYYQRKATNASVTPQAVHAACQDELKEVLLSKPALMEQALKGVLLYRFATCPFCGRVKALLDNAGIPHTVVEVDPMRKTELSSLSYKKVPQLLFANGANMVDSTEITTMLGGVLKDKITADAQQWRDWSTACLARYIVLDVNQTFTSACGAYGYVDDVTSIPWWSKQLLKSVGGPIMYLVARYRTGPEMARKHGYDGNPRKTLLGEMDRWASSCKAGGFHGGKSPDVADLDVYGVLQSARCSGLYEEIMQSSNAHDWMKRMDDHLKVRRVEL